MDAQVGLYLCCSLPGLHSIVLEQQAVWWAPSKLDLSSTTNSNSTNREVQFRIRLNHDFTHCSSLASGSEFKEKLLLLDKNFLRYNIPSWLNLSPIREVNTFRIKKSNKFFCNLKKKKLDGGQSNIVNQTWFCCTNTCSRSTQCKLVNFKVMYLARTS